MINEAERVIKFIETLHLVDEYWGQRFKLLDWQRDILILSF